MSLFAAEQLIIDRITAEVPGFTTISNPSLIAGLRDIGPLLPFCVVAPGAADISSQQTNGSGVIEEQDWSLTIIVEHQADDADSGLTEDLAGNLMMSCIQALSGWYPGTPFVRSFTYAGRVAPDYGLGYAEFPLNFKVKLQLV